MLLCTIFEYTLFSYVVVSARQAPLTFQPDPMPYFSLSDIKNSDNDDFDNSAKLHHGSQTFVNPSTKLDGVAYSLNDTFSDLRVEEELVSLRKEAKQNPTPKQSSSCGVRNVNGVRIVGGSVTKNGEIPWRVAVFVYDKRTNRGGLCGGTIINRSWIMTAAHCTADYRAGRHGIKVYVGAQSNPVTVGSGTSIISDRFVQHPSYNSRNFDNDIALVHLETLIQYKPNVSPACLPSGSLVRQEFSGARVIASGWGTTDPVPPNKENNSPTSKTLRLVELPLLTTSQCAKYQSVTRNQICTYQPPKDTCQGDSGGSIDYRHTNGLFYAIGIVSYGVGCGQNRYPGVYTKVNNYMAWIEKTTGDSF